MMNAPLIYSLGLREISHVELDSTSDRGLNRIQRLEKMLSHFAFHAQLACQS